MLYHLVYTIDLNIQTFGLGACICSQTACYVRVCVCAGPKVLGFEGFVWGLWREKKNKIYHLLVTHVDASYLVALR